MLVELSYSSSKKKNADSLQIWCHGGFIYCTSRRFGERKKPYLFLLDFQVFLGFRGNQFVQVAPALRGYLVRRVDLRDQEVLDGCSVD